MKSFKILQFSIDFSTTFLIFSLASGGSAPRTPSNPYFQNFLKFSLNFRENFDTILKIFQKIINFSLIFKHYLKIFEFEKMRNFWFLQSKKVPPPSLPGRPPPIRDILYKLLVIKHFSLECERWMKLKLTNGNFETTTHPIAGIRFQTIIAFWWLIK